MKEIINIQIGQCGNNVGSKFWETISEQHQLGKDGKLSSESQSQQKMQSYFNETMKGKYEPRSILTDLESGTIQSIIGGPYGHLYNPQSFIYGSQSASNNFAKGYYGLGQQIIQRIKEGIRRQIEKCQNFEGIQICHSIGGGTGSGLGSKIIDHLRDYYSYRITQSFTVFPSKKVSDIVTEPYNSVLSLRHLIQTIDNVFIFDNQSMYEKCTKNKLKTQKITYSKINRLMVDAMSGITSSYRIPNSHGFSLSKISCNLIPYPTLRFFLIGLSPLGKLQNDYKQKQYLTKQLTKSIFDKENILCRANPLEGRIFTAWINYRGDFTQNQIEQECFNIQNKSSSSFVGWIPNNVCYSKCKVPLKEHPKSQTFIINSGSINDLLSQIHQSCLTMKKKKAFFHWYAAEGLDEFGLIQALDSVQELRQRYQIHQNQTVEQEDY